MSFQSPKIEIKNMLCLIDLIIRVESSFRIGILDQRTLLVHFSVQALLNHIVANENQTPDTSDSRSNTSESDTIADILGRGMGVDGKRLGALQDDGDDRVGDGLSDDTESVENTHVETSRSTRGETRDQSKRNGVESDKVGRNHGKDSNDDSYVNRLTRSCHEGSSDVASSSNQLRREVSPLESENVDEDGSDQGVQELNSSKNGERIETHLSTTTIGDKGGIAGGGVDGENAGGRNRHERRGSHYTRGCSRIRSSNSIKQLIQECVRSGSSRSSDRSDMGRQRMSVRFGRIDSINVVDEVGRLVGHERRVSEPREEEEHTNQEQGERHVTETTINVNKSTSNRFDFLTFLQSVLMFAGDEASDSGADGHKDRSNREEHKDGILEEEVITSAVKRSSNQIGDDGRSS